LCPLQLRRAKDLCHLKTLYQSVSPLSILSINNEEKDDTKREQDSLVIDTGHSGQTSEDNEQNLIFLSSP
jgi:hypothetical protein